MATQLQTARKGEITEQIEYVARVEGVEPDILRDEIAAGRVVIPANKLHLKTNLKPAGIGRILTTKTNANIGTSSESSTIEGEIEKMNACLEVGADAIMDLSTGAEMDKTRRILLEHCPVVFGTVPIYQVIEGRGVDQISSKVIMDVVQKQAAQGVDFFTIHAGLLKEHLPLVKSRVAGIVSRGGALLAKWMMHHNKQNPLYEMFDDLCDVMAEYDICFSLGDGLRPGAIADATDAAQIAELETLGELTQRAQERGCQVMVEGPGHVPFDQIQYNMELQQKICKGAPFYVLGPLVTDIGVGYDHITSAIGATAAAFYGASFICYVTPREHLGLPTIDDVRAGVVAAKIAAHAADVARGIGKAAQRDRELSIARANLDWENHLGLALDTKTAKAMYEQVCSKSVNKDGAKDYCSMCGKDWCSLRTNRDIKQQLEASSS
ncbi:MAG: phosphomethylpyrimidine synthase ThiC [Phycisphaerae bacterium]|nr:phosphomethylpyrimidine synthase ThiC [Phycisphaerae bacterium]